MSESRVPMIARGTLARVGVSVGVSVVVVAALTGCSVGSTVTPTPGLASSARPSGPLPIKVGVAPPGTYTTTLFDPTLTFDVQEEGWMFFFVDDVDEMAMGKAGDIQLTAGRVAEVVDPTSHRPAAAPDDLIAWLEDHPDLEVTPGPAAEIVGSDARSVDATVPGGEDVDIWAYPTGNLRVSAGTRARIWVVQIDGPDLVFVGFAPVDAFDTAIPELEALATTFEFAGG